MNKSIAIGILLLVNINNVLTAQNFIVEKNEEIDITYSIYSPPLKINPVKFQKDIDYSKISGLLQSYLSADNLEWALSDYFVKPNSIDRNQEHFVAVKKQEYKDYIQIESIYLFEHKNRDFAYVKYSMIFEKLPFPWVSIFTLEKINNRWYFSKILNQNQVLILLGNTTPQFLLQCFNKKSNDINISKMINESIVNDRLSIARLSLKMNNFDKNLKEKFYDNRIFNDTLKNFRNALIDSYPKQNIFKVNHPFLLENFKIENYDKSYKNLIKTEETVLKYKNSPEMLILNSNTPVNLISKITLSFNSKNFYLIKFMKNKNVEVATIMQTNNLYSFDTTNIFLKFSKVFQKHKTSILIDHFTSIKNEYIGVDGGINLDELIIFIDK